MMQAPRVTARIFSGNFTAGDLLIQFQLAHSVWPLDCTG